MSAEAPNERDAVPEHLAVICDGNGRWARAHGLSRRRGHEEGVGSVRAVTEECVRVGGIRQVTYYGLSYDNRLKRPKSEISALYQILRRYLRRELPVLMENNIRFRVIGEIDDFPKSLRDEIARAVTTSAPNSGMVMCLALNYSGRREIAHAAGEIARRVRDGELDPGNVSVDDVARGLFTVGMPDVDLLVRAGGDMRVSDFLLWQISYAEIYVTDVYWPDFREPQLHEALDWFATRQRRFGAVKGN
ncbi:MAG TPA: polyprenyl diphosphate synthase [Planctomycetota bacterium]|nr:polyprenyl diphosphate synthase [Planctomycetota bacterium]